MVCTIATLIHWQKCFIHMTKYGWIHVEDTLILFCLSSSLLISDWFEVLSLSSHEVCLAIYMWYPNMLIVISTLKFDLALYIRTITNVIKIVIMYYSHIYNIKIDLVYQYLIYNISVISHHRLNHVFSDIKLFSLVD